MNKNFIFIDESGSPDFFTRRKRPLWLEDSFQPLLVLGLILVQDRKRLRKAIKEFQNKILLDPLYNSIPSVTASNWFLHAKDDHAEVRIQFFELIRQLDDVRFFAVIARKIPELFIAKHNGNAKEFYFDILQNLIRQIPFEKNQYYQFYLSKRDSTNAKPFSEAVQRVIAKLESQPDIPYCSFKCDIVKSQEYPELSVVDYLLWAINRYITKGERRFLTALEEKYCVIHDIYDFECANNLYNSANPFLLEKVKDFFEYKK